MTKRLWRPAWRTTADGKLEIASAPTEDEVEDLLHQLSEWRLAHPEAMPAALWAKLRQFIEWQTLQYPWSRERIRQVRAHYVREGLELKGSLKAAYEYAADALAGSPAEAGSEMKKDFDEVMRACSPSKARRRRVG